MQVYAGNTTSQMALIYTSPEVGRGFFTKPVTVALPADRLVRVTTVLHTDCAKNNGLHGLVMGKIAFVPKSGS